MSERAQVKSRKVLMTKNYELNVFVNGKSIDIYNHKDEFYAEGREGTEYKLELKNNTYADAEFVVSIDGLSIINGKPASKESTGYIVKPKSSVIIEGWTVDSSTAAKFVFGSKKKSYSNQSGYGVDNTGVIGLRVFPRKYATLNSAIVPHWQDHVKPQWPPHTRGPFWLTGSNEGVVRSFGTSSMSNNMTLGSAAVDSIASAYTIKGANSGPELTAFAAPEEVSSLGTEFGAATDFKTVKVEFVRQSKVPAFEYVLYYATADELNKKGIVLSWQKQKVTPKPKAFPGDYCTPPEGWSTNG